MRPNSVTRSRRGSSFSITLMFNHIDAYVLSKHCNRSYRTRFPGCMPALSRRMCAAPPVYSMLHGKSCCGNAIAYSSEKILSFEWNFSPIRLPVASEPNVGQSVLVTVCARVSVWVFGVVICDKRKFDERAEMKTNHFLRFMVSIYHTNTMYASAYSVSHKVHTDASERVLVGKQLQFKRNHKFINPIQWSFTINWKC